MGGETIKARWEFYNCFEIKKSQTNEQGTILLSNFPITLDALHCNLQLAVIFLGYPHRVARTRGLMDPSRARINDEQFVLDGLSHMVSLQAYMQDI